MTYVISTYSDKDTTAGSQRTSRSMAHTSDQSLSTTTSSCQTLFGTASTSATALPMLMTSLLNPSLPPLHLCNMVDLSVELLFFYSGNWREAMCFECICEKTCMLNSVLSR